MQRVQQIQCRSAWCSSFPPNVRADMLDSVDAHRPTAGALDYQNTQGLSLGKRCPMPLPRSNGALRDSERGQKRESRGRKAVSRPKFGSWTTSQCRRADVLTILQG